MSLRINKCCFCIPLRGGLLAWGYFALLIIYIHTLVSLYLIQKFIYDTGKFDPGEFIGFTLSFMGSIVHFIFYIILIAGLHKKGRGLLDVFNGYTVVTMILQGVILALYIPWNFFRFYMKYEYMVLTDYLLWIILPVVILIILNMLIQFYVLCAVRSLISKLHDEKEDSIINYLAEDCEEVFLRRYDKKKDRDLEHLEYYA